MATKGRTAPSGDPALDERPATLRGLMVADVDQGVSVAGPNRVSRRPLRTFVSAGALTAEHDLAEWAEEILAVEDGKAT